jgi:hypothetical protein
MKKYISIIIVVAILVALLIVGNSYGSKMAAIEAAEFFNESEISVTVHGEQFNIDPSCVIKVRGGTMVMLWIPDEK